MRFFWVCFLGIFSFVGLAKGQDLSDLPNAGQIQAGSNYFGQSIGLSYSRDLAGPLWADFALETQSISFQSLAGKTFFIFYNNSNTSYNVGLDVHEMVTAGLSFHRSDKGMLRWVNSLGIGVTYFDLAVHVSLNAVNDPSDIYQGQREISAFALYTDLHLLDFHPPGDRLFLSLGVKCSTAFLSSPQTVITTNAAGHVFNVSEYNPNGGSILFPDLEGYLGLGYEFE